MRHSFLMCPPTYFECSYDINSWMTGNIGKVDRPKAIEQWQALVDIIQPLADVEIVDPVPGLPDMVFTANAAYLHNNTAWISTFKNVERKGEEPYFAAWFRDHGYNVIHVADDDFVFEGAGDCLDDSHGETWIGYGQRTTESSTRNLCKHFADHVWHKLYLKTGHFYHLDTCFCPLSKGHILWYSNAFDTASRLLVTLLRGGNNLKGVHSYDSQMHIDYQCFLVDIDQADARQFACNAVCIDEHIVCNTISDSLKARLERLGYTVHTTDLSEFMKAGGAAKCLTLQLR